MKTTDEACKRRVRVHDFPIFPEVLIQGDLRRLPLLARNGSGRQQDTFALSAFGTLTRALNQRFVYWRLAPQVFVRAAILAVVFGAGVLQGTNAEPVLVADAVIFVPFSLAGVGSLRVGFALAIFQAERHQSACAIV